MREILQHRMRGIAEQRDAAAAPFVDRRPVAHHPHAPAFDLAEQCPHRLAGLCEPFVQFRRIAVAVPAFRVSVGMEHGDEVEQFAAAQRILHEMGFLAGPDHHSTASGIFPALPGRQHGAIGDVAGGGGLPSPATICRIIDQMPSAPINAAP